MRTWRFALLALAALSLSACVSVKEPVGTTVGFANDPALEGLWVGKADKDKPDTYVHILATDDKSFTVVGVTERQGDDKAGWGTMTVTTVLLGGHHYANLRDTSENGEAADANEGVIPLLYTVSGDTLSLSMFDPEKVEDAIAAHRVEGTVEKGNRTDTIAITADAAHLDAWLAKPDAAGMFKPAMVLRRVK
jgi:hypothetical protein